MSLGDAVQRLAVVVEGLQGVDIPPTGILSSQQGEGQFCPRCEGKGWFHWHGVMRWCSPSCIASHLEEDFAITVEPRNGFWE